MITPYILIILFQQRFHRLVKAVQQRLLLLVCHLGDTADKAAFAGNSDLQENDIIILQEEFQKKCLQICSVKEHLL